MKCLLRVAVAFVSAAVVGFGGAGSAVAAATSPRPPSAAQERVAATAPVAQTSMPSLADCNLTGAGPLLYRIAAAHSGAKPAQGRSTGHCTPAQRAAAMQHRPSAIATQHVVATGVPSPASPSKPSPGAKPGQTATPGQTVDPAVAVHISGKVTNMSAAGVPNIAMQTGSYTTGYCCSTATTAGDGSFSLSVAPGASYWIGLTDGSGTYPNGYYETGVTGNFTIDTSSLTQLPVGSGGATVNITLPSFATITGQVTLSGSPPWPGVGISACAGYCYSAVGASDGTYSISVASTFSYTLLFSDSTGNNISGSYFEGADGNFGIDGAEATPILVPPAGVSGINITLAKPVLLRGTVTNSAASVVPNPGVMACAIGHVACYPTSNSWIDGTYMIKVAPNRRYTLTVDGGSTYAAGYYDSRSPGHFTLDPDAASAIAVSTTDIPGLDVTLPNTVQISGYVMTPSHYALSGASAFACDAYKCYTANANDGGAYSIVVPVNDSFFMWFYDGVGTYAGGYLSGGSVNNFSADPDDASWLSVASDGITGVNIALPLAVRISGRITNTSGTPLVGTTAWACIHPAAGACYSYGAQSLGTYYGAGAGLDGAYSLIVAPNEDYYVYFSDESKAYAGGFWSSGGYTPDVGSATKVAVGTSNRTGINGALPPAVQISGQITGANGDPLSFVDAWACEVGTTACFYATSYSGHYSIGVLPNHSYILEFDSNSTRYINGFYSGGPSHFTIHQADATAVNVAGGSLSGIDIALPSPVRIEGNVTNPGAAAVPGVRVFACTLDSTGPCYDATTSADGSYSVEVLPGNDYSVFFRDDSGTYVAGFYASGASGQYAADPGAATPVSAASTDVPGIDITLPAAVHISGTVTSTTAAPLGGVIAWACIVGTGTCFYSFVADDGHYAVPVLPSHDYVVEYQDLSDVYPGGFYSSAGLVDVLGSATPVEVLATDVSGIDVVFTTAATTFHALTPPARVLDTRPTGSGRTNIGLTGKSTAGTVRTFQVAGARYVGGGTKVAVPTGSTAVTGNLTIVGETADGLVALGPTMTPTGDVTTINFVKGDVRANNVTVALAVDGSLSAVYRSSTAGATLDLIFDVTGYFTPDTTGATYHTLAPGRVLDSRKTGSGHTNIGLSGKFANKSPRTFTVAGVKALGWSSALVPSNATAVTGNVTVTNATSAGYVSVGPTIAAVPPTSTVNVAAGANIANGVTVALKSGKLQAVWVGTAGSSADVLFDVTGYFTTGLSGLRFYPIAPARVLDTMTNLGISGVFATGSSQSLAVGGVGHVPADAAGISGNLTVLNASSNGYAFISPATVATPTSSTVNITAHRAGANGFDLALSSGHLSIIWVGAVGSTADIQLDVTGYWK